MFDKLKEKLKRLLIIIKRPEMTILPGHLAFFLVLSILPLFMVIFIIASTIPFSVELMTDFVKGTFPADVADVLLPLFTGRTFGLETTVFILVSIFVASKGFSSIIVVANTFYNNKRKNNIIRRIKSIILTILLLLLFLFMIVVLAFGNNIMLFVSDLIGAELIYDYVHMFYLLLKWPFAFVFMLVLINLIYTLAPDNSIRSKTAFPGALFTTITWILATWLYSIWVDNFSNYGVVYGSFSTIIVMMIWIYLLSYLFVLGLAINANSHNNKKIEGDLDEQNDK